MKKVLLIIIILGVAIGVGAVLDILPEPLQTKIENAFNSWIPAKDNLKEKAAKHSDEIWKSAQ